MPWSLVRVRPSPPTLSGEVAQLVEQVKPHAVAFSFRCAVRLTQQLPPLQAFVLGTNPCSVRGLLFSMCRKISAAIPSGPVPGSTTNGNPSLIRGLFMGIKNTSATFWITVAGPVPTPQVVRFRRRVFCRPPFSFRCAVGLVQQILLLNNA